MINVTRIQSPFKAKRQYFFVLLSLLFCVCESVPGQKKIEGFICDENHYPYCGASLILNDKMGAVSDAKGKFVFTEVRSGQFKIEVSAIGYQGLLLFGNTDTISTDLYLVLSPVVQILEEVKVNGNRSGENKRSESISIQLIEEEFLKESKASNLMQTLNNIPGISSMDIGTGVSKPMIRGMGYYRVVVAQNGIKQEGQQWSNHHGVSIDQEAVSHVEIVKGSASLQYGSDAIGGVINVLPPHVPITSGITGEISFTGKSNTQWFGSSANLSFRKGDFYSNAIFTYNNFGDIKIPYTDYFWLATASADTMGSHKVKLGDQLYNTSGREEAVSISGGIVKPWGNSYLEFNFYEIQTGFFDWQGIQNDSTRTMHEQGRRDIQLPYQKVNNFSIHHFTNRYFQDDKLELAIGYQLNDAREFKPFIDKYGIRTDDYLYFKERGYYDLGLFQHTLSGNAFYTIKTIEKQTIKIGINTQYQNHRTDGYDHILPEYKRFSTGIFLTHQYKISDRWLINSGARADYTYIELKESLNPEFPDNQLDSLFNPNFDKIYPGTAFSLGFNYFPGKRTIVKVHAGKSFRVPSAYELEAYGTHTHEGRFENGDVNNRAEEAWQFDVGFEHKQKHYVFLISPFLNYFTNYLFLDPTSEFAPGGAGQIYEYTQSKAMLYGGEASFDFTFKKSVFLKAGAEYVYAVNLDLKSALPTTPPFTMQTELSYLYKDTKSFRKSKVGIELITVAPQEFTVPNELRTPGYFSVNLLAMTEVVWSNQKIDILLKVSNLLNTAYYNHISFYRRMRIPEPGRDVQLFISIPIE